jgi:hypothetical protein
MKPEFDDIVEDEDGIWTQVCIDCARKFNILDEDKTNLSGGEVCGVKGCANEAHCYYDIEAGEAR